MNSIDSRLEENETIIYRTQCHWAILLGPAFVIFIGGLALRPQGLSAIILMAFGFLWGTLSYFNLRASELALTNRRLLIHAGFPIMKSYDIPLGEVAAVDFYQPSLGSMLNFGKIIMVRRTKRRSVVRFVSSPAEFVAKARERIGASPPSR
jgi:hypothetical protein